MNEELKRFDEYKATVTRLFPVLPRDLVNGWSIQDADAIVLARFLECYPREPIFVLEVGTFVGTSAFHFACQPKVSEVVSIDTNISLAKLADLVVAKKNQDIAYRDAEDFGPGASPNVGVLDVAEAALACFPEQWQKVRLVTGTTESVHIPSPSNGASLVAFVDGSHGKERVEADLRAIFEHNPYAVAVLHDCVEARTSPAVLTGVAAFIEASSIGYRFRLFKQLGTLSTSPNLGILYPETMAEQLEQAARGLLECPTSALFRVSYLQWRASSGQKSHSRQQSHSQQQNHSGQQTHVRSENGSEARSRKLLPSLKLRGLRDQRTQQAARLKRRARRLAKRKVTRLRRKATRLSRKATRLSRKATHRLIANIFYRL